MRIVNCAAVATVSIVALTKVLTSRMPVAICGSDPPSGHYSRHVPCHVYLGQVSMVHMGVPREHRV